MALPDTVVSEQIIRVFTSSDGFRWSQRFSSVDPKFPAALAHDSAWLILLRNDADPADPHVVLSWYDTRADPALEGHYFGDHFGGAVFTPLGSTTPRYYFAWTESPSFFPQVFTDDVTVTP